MSLAEVAEMPLRIWSESPGGGGKETVLQFVPFQCRMLCSPTAQTSFEAMAKTPLSCHRLGVGTTVQTLPSPCMVSAPPSCPVGPDWYQPTAQTSLAETADTAFNTLPL